MVVIGLWCLTSHSTLFQ